MSAEHFIDIVFDGPPGPESGRSVEVENEVGKAINVGEWVKRLHGLAVLRIPSIFGSDLAYPSVKPSRLTTDQLKAVDAALAALASPPLSMLRQELEDCLQLLRSAHQAIAQGSITPALYRSLCDATGDHPNEDVIRLLDERA